MIESRRSIDIGCLGSNCLTEIEREEVPLEAFVLARRGFSNLEDAVNYGFDDESDLSENESYGFGIPLWIARQLIIVDQVDTSTSNKEKLFAYRLWEETGSFQLVKDYLPEHVLSLEDLQGSLSSMSDKPTRSRARISQMLHDVLVEEETLGAQYDLVEKITYLVNPILIGEKSSRKISIRRTRVLSRTISSLFEKGYGYEFLVKNKFLIRDGFEKEIEGEEELSMKKESPYINKAKSILIDIAINDPLRKIVVEDLARRYGMSKKFFTKAKKDLKDQGYVFNDNGSVVALIIDIKEEVVANGGKLPPYRYLTRKYRTNTRRVKSAFEQLQKQEPDIFR